VTLDDVLREHGPAIWRVVASYAPPGSERDDLAQEVLVAIWEALGRFRGEGSLKGYVLRIAHNRGVSRSFARSKQQTSELVDVPDPRPSVEDHAVANQRAERLLRHLRRLPLGQRQVLALALEGLPHAEIGLLLGITAENVAVRLGRAKEALRRSMNDEEAP
jgi:RNA polymerase sigma-70 factor (ECF subfamily)